MLLVEALRYLIFYGSAAFVVCFIIVSLLVFMQSAFDNVVIHLSQAIVVLKATTTPFPIVKRHKEEEFYEDPASGSKLPFPLLADEPSIDLSVIIPAYEEEQRLPVMLDECMEFLESKHKRDTSFTYEVIIVSDGSKDGTVKVGMKYCKQYSTAKVRVLDLVENRGKGGAVRLVSDFTLLLPVSQFPLF